MPCDNERFVVPIPKGFVINSLDGKKDFFEINFIVLAK